jgi:hypothetical protein
MNNTTDEVMVEKWGRRVSQTAAAKYGVSLDLFQTYEEWRKFCKRANEQLHGGMKKRYAADPAKFQARAAKRHSTLSNKRKEFRRQLKGGGISISERIIYNILAAKVGAANISASHHIKLEGGEQEAANRKRIFIDFFLPEYGIAIEYDGPHHFGKAFYLNRKGDKSNTIIEQDVESITQRDKFLYDWCASNGIKLYRLSHDPWMMRSKKIQKLLAYVLPKLLDKSMETDDKGYIPLPNLTTEDRIAIGRITIAFPSVSPATVEPIRE